MLCLSIPLTGHLIVCKDNKKKQTALIKFEKYSHKNHSLLKYDQFYSNKRPIYQRQMGRLFSLIIRITRAGRA